MGFRINGGVVVEYQVTRSFGTLPPVRDCYQPHRVQYVLPVVSRLFDHLNEWCAKRDFGRLGEGEVQPGTIRGVLNPATQFFRGRPFRFRYGISSGAQGP